MTDIVKRLKTLAALFLKEEEASKINLLITEKSWNALRLYVGDLLGEYEVRLLVKNNQDSKLEEWLMIEEMDDIATDLAIQMQDVNEEKQPKRTRRKRIWS